MFEDGAGFGHQGVILFAGHFGGEPRIHLLDAVHLRARFVVHIAQVRVREVAAYAIASVKLLELRDAADSSAAKSAAIALKARPRHLSTNFSVA